MPPFHTALFFVADAQPLPICARYRDAPSPQPLNVDAALF